jgi:hypothetical protein
MDRDEFERILSNDPHLSGPIRRAAGVASKERYGLIMEAAIMALMFPIVKYLLTNIGLPWLQELKRYSELQRRKVHEWIDEKCRAEGFNPDAAEPASDALCEQLERTTDAAARASWDHLAELMKASPDAK